MASSGIVANLFPGVRTAHATFLLSLDLTKNHKAVCNVNKNSGSAEVLKKCSLIVWDEVTMSHKNALKAVNRTL